MSELPIDGVPENGEEVSIGEWISLSTSIKGSILKKNNLKNRTPYVFRIRKKDHMGEWDFFSAPSETFWTLPAGTLRMKSGPVIQSIEYDSVVLSWVAVENASCYQLQMAEYANPVWNTVSSMLHQTTVRKKGLSAGQSWIFRVRPLFHESGASSQTDDESTWTFSEPSDVVSPPSLANNIRKILPGELINAHGEKIPVDKLAGKVVAFYFSAHWCGPCRSFTPQLSNFYQQMKRAERQFEVVFVSCDHDTNSMLSYFQTMPWLAVSFEENARLDISSHFDIKGIPRLIVFGKSGKVVAENAVQSGLTEQLLLTWTTT